MLPDPSSVPDPDDIQIGTVDQALAFADWLTQNQRWIDEEPPPTVVCVGVLARSIRGVRAASAGDLSQEAEVWRQHSIAFNTHAFRVAHAIGKIPDGATEYRGNVYDDLTELIARATRETP